VPRGGSSSCRVREGAVGRVGCSAMTKLSQVNVLVL
jgi:hypothetical protein